MIWESTFLIIQNCKMHEKLNEEKAEQMNTGISKNKMHTEVLKYRSKTTQCASWLLSSAPLLIITHQKCTPGMWAGINYLIKS